MQISTDQKCYMKFMGDVQMTTEIFEWDFQERLLKTMFEEWDRLQIFDWKTFSTNSWDQNTIE